MIPVLFDRGQRDFGGNGEGLLVNTIESYAHEVANSQYELFLKYPTLDYIDGIYNGMWEKLKVPESQILYKPSHSREPHLFRIYDYEIDSSEQTISVFARSRSFDLAGNPLKEKVTINKIAPNQALQNMKAKLLEPTDFTLYSDITTPSSTEWVDRSGLSTIMGESGSIIQIWGGEVLRENHKISILKRLGRDNVTTLRLGKNISKLEYEESSNGIVSAIIPYFKYEKPDTKDEINLYGPIIKSPNFNKYQLPYYDFVEFTEEDGVTDPITLHNVSKNWFKTNSGIDSPKINIKVDMVDLAESTEYENLLRKLETVNVFDTVSVYVEKYEMDILIKVNSLKYDGIREKNIEVELGNVQKGLFGTVMSPQIDAINKEINKVKKYAVGVQTSADGKNSNYHGTEDPNLINLPGKTGDIYFRKVGTEKQMWQYYDGQWNLILDTERLNSVEKEVALAMTAAEKAKLDAKKSYDDSVAEANKLVKAQSDKFTTDLTSQKTQITQDITTSRNEAIANANAEIKKLEIEQNKTMNGIKTEANEIKKTADKTKADIDLAITNAGFTSLDDTLKDINKATTEAKAEALKKIDKIVFEEKLGLINNDLNTKVNKEAYDLKIKEINDEVVKKANKAVVDAELAKKVAQTTYDAKVLELGSNINKKLDIEVSNAQKALQDAEIAKKVAQTAYDAKVLEINKNIDKKLDTSVADAQKLIQDAEIAKKVAIDTYNKKVTELNTEISKKYNTTDANAQKVIQDAEIAKKVAKTAYDAKVLELGTAISGNELRIEKTETGLLAKASSTDVNALKTRVSQSETNISTNSKEIALKASQTDLDTTKGRLDTAESSLVVQAGEIASKVGKTEFNAVDNRLKTAESSITQQAGLIESKVSQTIYDTDIKKVKDDVATKASNIEVNALKTRVSTSETKITQTEKDIALRATKTEVNALGTKVGNAETSITANADAIALKAEKNDLDATNGRLKTAESAITVHSGQIASKVSNVEYNKLNDRVKSAESSITQQAGEIKSKVALAEFNNLTGRVSSSESTISQLSGQIALRVTKTEVTNAIKDGIDSIEISGRNYFRNSDKEVTAVREFVNSDDWDLAPLIDKYGIDRTYAISFDLKSKKDGTISVYAQNGSSTKYGIGSRGFVATGEYQRYSFTFKPSLNNSNEKKALLAFYGEYGTGRIPTVKNVKFEPGNKATDYSKALEDTENSLKTLDEKIKTNETGIIANENQIKLKANQSELNTVSGNLAKAQSELVVQSNKIATKVEQSEFNKVEGRVKTAESSITQQAGQIATKVETTTFDAANKRLSNAESSITQQAGQIATKVSKTDFDNIAGKVASNETKITQTEKDIALRATKTELNALGTKVGTAEAAIIANAGAISLKAAKTDLDSTNVRLKTAESKLVIQADEIASKVSNTEYNKLDNRVKTAESSITQQAGLIATKVSQTDFNGLSGKLASAETSITQNKDDIALRATKSEVDPLKTRLTKAESGITQNANQITIKADKTELDKVSGRLTTAESEIVTQADSIKLKVAQTDFNNLTKKVETAEASINVNKNQIALKAEKVLLDSLTGRVKANEADIVVANNGIKLAATKTEVNKAVEDVKSDDRTEVLSGTEIFTDKADDANVHVEIDGQSVQNAGSGKNLFPVHLLNTEKNTLRLKPNTNYTMSSNVPEQKVGHVLYFNYLSRGVYINNPRTETTNAEGELYFHIYPSREFTNDLLNGNYWIQLEEGTVATPYEPPAPTPDYPIAINSLNDVDIVSSVGRENLKISSLPFPNVSERLMIEMSTENSYTNKESIKATRLINELTYLRISTDERNKPLEMKKGEVVTLSFYVYNPSGINGNLSFVNNSGGHKEIDYKMENIGNGYYFYKRTQVAEMDIKTSHGFILYMSLPIGESLYLSGIQIERSEDRTQHSIPIEDISYDTKSPTIYKTNISLTEPLRSVGDVKDKLFRDTDGLWKVERNVKEGDISTYTWNQGNPSSGWNQSGDTTAFYGYALRDLDIDVSKEAMVDRFKTFKSGMLVHNTSEGFDVGNSGNYSVLRIKNSRLAELSPLGLREWLTANSPIIIQFAQKNPVVEVLPQEDQTKLNNIQSFKNSNYIYTVDKSGIFKPELHATFKSKDWYRNEQAKEGIKSVSSSLEIESDRITQTIVKVDGNNKIINQVKSTSEQNSSAIKNQLGEITLIKQNVGSISASVAKKAEQSDLTLLSNRIDLRVQKTEKDILTQASALSVLSDSVDLQVQKIKDDIVIESGRITTLSNQINLRVQKVEEKNTSLAGSITILSDKVDTQVQRIDKDLGVQTGRITVEANKISSLLTRVSGAETLINTTKSTADGNKTTISNHASKFTTIESNINGIKTNVANKAEQSQVTQLANSLSSKVSSSEVSNIIKNDLSVKDTRNENYAPNYYYQNHNKQETKEFKNVSTIGLTSYEAGGSYGLLVTTVHYGDPSGGKIKQVLYGDKATFQRFGTGVNPVSNINNGYWSQWVELANKDYVSSEILQLSNSINLKVSKGDVSSQINIEAGRTLISTGKLILDANTYIMGTTFANDIKAKSLDAVYADIANLRARMLTADVVVANHIMVDYALINKLKVNNLLANNLISDRIITDSMKANALTAITANITSIRSQILVSNVVEANHLKSDNAMIDKLFATSALIDRLTSKAAFINNIKAIDISADRISAGTINAARVNIINLNVSSLTGDTSNFVRSAWNNSTSGTELTPQGIKISNVDGSYSIISRGGIRSYDTTGSNLGYMGGAYSSAGNPLKGMAIYSQPGSGIYISHTRVGNENVAAIHLPYDDKSIVKISGELEVESLRLRGTSQRLISSSREGGAFVDTGKVSLGISSSRYGTWENKLSVFSDVIESYVTFSASTLNIRGTNQYISNMTGLGGMYFDTTSVGLGIGTLNGVSAKLKVTKHNIEMYSNIRMNGFTISGQSDRRLKKNITDVTLDSLKLFRQYNFVYFNWKSTDRPKDVQFGLIAQDTPFLSEVDKDGMYTINSSKQIMLNSLGVKQLDEKLTKIDTYVTQHELEIINLKKKIKLLEEKLV